MATTLPQRQSSNLFGHRFVAATFLVFAVAGSVAPPASAQPRGGGLNRSPAGAFDPCLSGLKILSFVPASPRIAFGASTILNWNIRVPRGCGHSYGITVSARPQNDQSPGAPQDWGIWTSSTAVAAQPQGTLNVHPAFNTVYMLLVAWGPNSSTSATTQVAVDLPLANPRCSDVPDLPTFSLMTVPDGGPPTRVARVPPQPCRRKVTIDANDLAPLLVQALGTTNTTVIVPDGVELDLTPHLGGPIGIAEGVHLIGGRIAEPGKRFERGPRLYVKPNPYEWNSSSWPDPLFLIDGDNVRISGVTLEGPGATPDAWRTKVPRPQCPSPPGCVLGYTRGIRFYDKINIEIDHNEIYGWNTAAVDMGGKEQPTGPDDHGRVWQIWTRRVRPDSPHDHRMYPPEPEPIYIHDNYFHNNFYVDPYFGYSVVASGTHALIERNVFNVYYHAIAASGDPESGYRAYRNLVLGTGNEKQQAFDAHHRRKVFGNEDDHAAGHDFDIRYNSFLYKDGPGFYINGTPDLKPNGAFVVSNVFTHDHVGDAVVARGNGLLSGNNLLGVKSWDDSGHHSDSCDFDGDGIPDRFLTTGQTWWYRSGAQSNTPWVYLNTSTLLVRDVRLVPSNDRPGCDVYAGGLVYKGGM